MFNFFDMFVRGGVSLPVLFGADFHECYKFDQLHAIEFEENFPIFAELGFRVLRDAVHHHFRDLVGPIFDVQFMLDIFLVLFVNSLRSPVGHPVFESGALPATVGLGRQ